MINGKSDPYNELFLEPDLQLFNVALRQSSKLVGGSAIPKNTRMDIEVLLRLLDNPRINIEAGRWLRALRQVNLPQLRPNIFQAVRHHRTIMNTVFDYVSGDRSDQEPLIMTLFWPDEPSAADAIFSCFALTSINFLQRHASNLTLDDLHLDRSALESVGIFDASLPIGSIDRIMLPSLPIFDSIMRLVP